MENSTELTGARDGTQAPANRREKVVLRLRSAIITGDLAPGTVLKDAEIAARMGYSATPVREALMQLAAEGLVEIRPNRLKRVAPLEMAAIVELLEVQIELWRLGYLWGTPNIGARELAALQRIYGDHAEALAFGDLTAAIAAALAFHRVILMASGNRELVRVSLDRLALIQRFVRLCAPELVSADMLKKHKEILAALERGDSSSAIAVHATTGDALLETARSLRDKN